MPGARTRRPGGGGARSGSCTPVRWRRPPRSRGRTAPDEPVLRLTRFTLDRDGRPIQVDRMVMPARSRRLRYEIAIETGP